VRNKTAVAKKAKRSEGATSTPITLSQHVAPVKDSGRVKWIVDFSFR
jgi:hypothetical protein